jgi:transglutaminase-like putative cysteine protease
VLAAGRADPYGLLASAIVVTAIGGWTLLDPAAGGRAQRLGRVGPLIVTGVGLLAAATLVPVAHAFEPRELVEPPVTEVELASPLPRLGAWAANPDLELMTVTGPAVPLRLAVLEQYDGTQWLAATRYRPLGTPAPATVLPPGAQGRTVTLDITLGDLGGNWLPTPGAPEVLSDRTSVVDPSTGTVFAPDLAQGLTYQVTGRVDDPDPERLVGATVPTTGPVQRYLTQPELPFDLATYGNLVTQDASTPYARALAIEAAVRRGRSLSSKAISGSAVWRLQSFLLGERGDPGGRVGTSEQFATAFAVLARHSGLPTRVVVGFRPGTAREDGSRTVRGSDALAWPEVYFDELGWVPFSPTPDDDTFAADRPQPGQAPQGPEVAVGPPAPADPPEPGDATGGSRGDAGLPWLPLGGAVLLLPPLGLLALRALRSWRHRRSGARGAWAEVLDGLLLAGRRGTGAESAVQLAERLQREVGTSAGARIAVLAERSAFAPDPPEGEFAPEAVREVRRTLRRSLPWWRRLWWPLDHRVLFRS